MDDVLDPSPGQLNFNPTFASHPLALSCSRSQSSFVAGALTGANAIRSNCMTTDDIAKIHLCVRSEGECKRER
jgi:hypothetical protein